MDRAETWAPRLALASTVTSVALLAPLVLAFLVYDSRLAFAQAADSFSDIFTATALFVALRVAARPPDADHPFGHERAEPIAALVAAVIAGVLAVEVLRDAIEALASGRQPTLEPPLVVVFSVKVAAKVIIAVIARRFGRAAASPALDALYVDARNDCAVGLLAVVGYAGARYGWSALDAWFAIPVGLFIGGSGLMLARENVRLLMGEAPAETRQKALVELVERTAGVLRVRELRARYHGAALDVQVAVVVDAGLSVRDARRVGAAVERALLGEDDVSHAVAYPVPPGDANDADATADTRRTSR